MAEQTQQDDDAEKVLSGGFVPFADPASWEYDQWCLDRHHMPSWFAQDGPRAGEGLEDGDAIPDGVDVTSSITASVWEISAKVGDRVKEGDKLVVLEAMKMVCPAFESSCAPTATCLLQPVLPQYSRSSTCTCVKSMLWTGLSVHGSMA